MVSRPQAVGHADDGLHDGAVFGVDGNVTHERLVDLELADAVALGGSSATNSLCRNRPWPCAHASCASCAMLHDLLGVVHGHAFGQLQPSKAGAAVRAAALRPPVREVAMAELGPGGHVDANTPVGPAHGVPPGGLAGGTQHPFADGQDQAVALSPREMNSAGEIGPSSGWFQRSSASTPMRRSLSSAIWGW